MDEKIAKIKEINRSFLITKKNYLFYKNSLQYIRYRVLRPLLKVKYGIFRFFHKPSPWLTPSSILFFESYLTKEHIGCEFGSGFSTLFFSKRVGKLVSIEHDPQWYEMISKKLGEMNITHVEYLLKPENDPAEFKDEVFSCETEDFKVRRDYVNYFRAIDQKEDAYFDFILVDGRARCECVYYSLPKLKKGGLMILDNSERERYKFVFDLLKDWEMVNTTNGLTNTTLWVKP